VCSIILKNSIFILLFFEFLDLLGRFKNLYGVDRIDLIFNMVQ